MGPILARFARSGGGCAKPWCAARLTRNGWRPDGIAPDVEAPIRDMKWSGPQSVLPIEGGENVRRSIAAAVALAVAALAAITPAANASAGTWTSIGTNQVASSPTSGAGYPIPAGSRVPAAGTCRSGPLNANHSESWIAVQPNSESLVGSSKFFFDKFSTFYMFYLGAYQVTDGQVTGNNQVQGYDCVSTGTQAMPPSWTDTNDPNIDFDTKARVYQTVLPFNAFWDAST